MGSAEDFIPSREADLFGWSNHFASMLTAGTGDNYGLTAAQTGNFDNLNKTWADAYVRIDNKNTRTPAAIIAKDDAKAAMIANARELARIIQANPDVTNEEKGALGLTVRDYTRTSVDQPSYPPSLRLESSEGNYVEIRLVDTENPDRRGKPDNVQGATILTAYGTLPPPLSDESAWTWKGNATRTLTVLEFPQAKSGETVWITAVWYNAKGQTSKPAKPLSVQIPGNLEATETSELRLTEDMRDAA